MFNNYSNKSFLSLGKIIKISSVIILAGATVLLVSCGGADEKTPSECKLDYLLDGTRTDNENNSYKTVTYIASFSDVCRTMATQKSSSGVLLSLSVSGNAAGYGFLKSLEIDAARTLSYTSTATTQISSNTWTYNLEVKPGLGNGYAHEWRLPWDISRNAFNSRIIFSFAADTDAKDLPKVISLGIKALD